MNRSASRRPGAGKAPPSLQQQLASGKRAQAARHAQQAQGRRRAPDAVAPVPEAAALGANVAGASHVSASRLLALLTQPAASPPAAAVAPQPQPLAYSPQVAQAATSSPHHALPYAAPFAATSTASAASSVSDNRRRQMGSSIFNNDTPPPPPSHTIPHTSRSYQPPHPQHTHQPPPVMPQQQQPTPLIVAPTAPMGAAVQAVIPSPTSPTARQSWGGGGRSLEAGDGARDAERQKKLEMRANLDAQMREKEEKKRLEKLQSSRAQEHWLDAPSVPRSTHMQPPPTASYPPTAMPPTATPQPLAATMAASPYATASAAQQPYAVELVTSRTLSSPHAPSAPSSSVHLSSIRSHNQSSSVFTAAGNDTADQRKVAVRQEVQAALRQQMEDKKRREEEKKRAEVEEERRWEEKLERERREMTTGNRHVNGGAAVEEERKEAVVTARGRGRGADVASVGVVQEEKQQLTVREDRRDKVERKRANSDNDSDSDEEDIDKRRKRKSKDRKASRERGRRSTRRHSDSDHSASSHSDDSDHHHTRRRRSSRQRTRHRRERRSRYSSQSEDEDDECIYVADSAYTHRLRYEQEQKEIDSASTSASTSRRSTANHKSKPNSSASNRSSSPALSAPSAPQVKPPFGVRSLQSRAKPKPPASRVRPPPPPLPMGDTKASKQALSAARLAMGRTSGGGDKFVAQKWKEKKAATQQETPVERERQVRTAEGSREGRDSGSRGKVVAAAVHSVVDEVVAGVQELSFADRLDSTSEWLLPHSLGLPSFRG